MPRNPRRDRRGHGPRGPLSPPHVPLSRTRAQRFDDLVLDAVERLEPRWGDALRGVEFAVEDVPVADPTGAATGVPLGRVLPARPSEAARVVVYRRPVETRAEPGGLGALVHDVVVAQVADLLGLEPETVDPDWEDPADR